jgi:ATP-dependent DNA helicase
MDLKDLPETITRFYPHPGFTELYPPQTKVIESGLLDGASLVVATPTASGKTLLAEFAMLNSINQGGKCLYIVPLKALASEKFDRFSLFDVNIGMSTGDYDVHDDKLGQNDIIVTTSEKADSLLRNGVEWMRKLSVIVADEIHLLDSMDRGPTLEVTLTKLKKLNPHAQILALSATVSNADEISQWLGAQLIRSDWRPVALHEGLYLTESATITFVQDTSQRSASKKAISNSKTDPPIALAFDTVREGGQSLVFVNTRRNAESLAKKMATAMKSLFGSVIIILDELDKLVLYDDFVVHTIRHDCTELAAKIYGDTAIEEKLKYCVQNSIAFHHAGLSSDDRKLVEAGFKENCLKVIVATPTLAAGLNLPARRVIIRDYKRYDANYGMTDIPVLEYKQMAGRAGRPGFDYYGEAILIAKSPNECEALAEHYILSEAEDVKSKLGIETALRMHVLSTISEGFARTRDELERFFGATFFGFQQQSSLNLTSYVIDNVLAFLAREEMIVELGGNVKATSFGHLVSKLYIDPLSAVKIRRGLKNAESASEVALLQLTCSTPDVRCLYMRSKDYHKVTEFVNKHIDEFLVEIPDPFRDVEYDWFLSEVKTAMLVYDWINEVSEKEITDKYNVGPGDIRNLVDTVQWISHALAELAAYLKVPSKRQARELTERVQHGINRELLDLVQLKNIGRVRGRKLFDAGFSRRKDVKNASFETIATLLGPAIAADVFEQLGSAQRVSNGKERPIEKPFFKSD